MSTEQLNSSWQSWKAQLAMGRVPSASSSEIVDTMCIRVFADDAVNSSKDNPRFRNALQMSLASALSSAADRIHDNDLQRVLSSLDPEWIAKTLILSERKKIASMDKRVTVLSTLLSKLCQEAGRQWVRGRAANWWRNGDFSEEEGDAFIRVILTHQVHRMDDIQHWGPQAAESALRVTRRAALDGELYWPIEDGSTVSLVGHSTTAHWLRERASLLQQHLTIPVDLKDSGLQKTELDRLSKTRLLDVESLPLWGRAIERRLGMPFRMLFHEFPEFAMLFHLDTKSASGATSSTSSMKVPLIRLMHMRLLLEAPSLSDSLSQPEITMVPDVIMYLLGQDYVSYSPELRVFDSCERRWRARWVETTAEAIGSLLLEDLLRFDLTTLSRIPETDEPTPDFMGETESKERIVFESKGATGWKTHREQRKEAMVQLGKATLKGRKSSKANSINWAGYGRSFAISLFAARQGDSKSSLLHVNDPPFIFDPLYVEGWEDRSRRSHFASVLQTAQLLDEADAVMQRNAFESKDNDTFTIDREDGLSFVGSYLPVQDWARRLHHPDLECIKHLMVFIGIEEARYRILSRGQLPPRFFRIEQPTEGPITSTAIAESNESVSRITSRSGALPSREYAGESRGIYSLLSNGSILAIETGP